MTARALSLLKASARDSMRTIARHRYLEVQSVACFLIVCAGTEGRYSPSPARSLIAPRPPLAGAAFLSARVSSPSPRLARRVRPAPCRPSTWQPASCRPRRVRPAHCLYAVSASRVRGLAAPCRQSQTNQPAVDSQILRARACVSTARACARARVVCVAVHHEEEVDGHARHPPRQRHPDRHLPRMRVCVPVRLRPRAPAPYVRSGAWSGT